MSSDRSHGGAGHGDLIRAEFSYDARNGSLDWSAVAGVEMESDDLLALDDPPMRRAIDLSIREGTPFSLGHSVVDANGVAHEIVLCGLPDTHDGHATMRGVVLELPAEEPAELPRLTKDLGRLPAGVSVHDLPWAGAGALPADLLAMVNLCLASGAPTALFWGEQRRVVYNQALADILPGYHPGLFGSSPPSDFPELWALARHSVERAFTGGGPATLTDRLVPLDVDGQIRNVYFSFSLTPIRQVDGTVVGLYAPAHETTQEVQRRRRLSTLHDLASSAMADGSIPELFSRITTTLAANPADVPFALMYMIEPGGEAAALQGATGLDPASAAVPERLAPDEAGGWAIAEVIEQGGNLMVDDVQDLFPGLQTLDGERPTRAMLAFADRGHDRLPSSLNILGVSTRQSLDVEYQQFLHEVARHVQADLGAVATAQLDRERSANLQRAMQSNRQIGAAIGILMTIHKVTEQQAFGLLSRSSQQSNRKLRDIADDVILSGTLPPEAAQPDPSRQPAARRGRNARNTR